MFDALVHACTGRRNGPSNYTIHKMQLAPTMSVLSLTTRRPLLKSALITQTTNTQDGKTYIYVQRETSGTNFVINSIEWKQHQGPIAPCLLECNTPVFRVWLIRSLHQL